MEGRMASMHDIKSRGRVENPGSPPRYKMALLTWAAAFPLLTAVNVLLGPELASLPLLGRTFLVTGILTSVLTFVVMPRLTQLCATWLFVSGDAKRQGERLAVAEKLTRRLDLQSVSNLTQG
jgi:antibiotic biosynthesis monooxygenase (ABM) superfamily enzyme